MKRFLLKECYKLNKIMKENDSDSEIYIKAAKTLREIEKLLNNLELNDNLPCNNIQTIYNEAYNIIKRYSNMSLLETELPLDYPILRTRRKPDKEQIINFINEVYNEEMPEYNTPNITNENIKIFSLPLIKKIINNGKCVLYKQYYEDRSIILLNSYYNIKDYINSTSIAVETYIYNYSDAKINLLKYYMKNRALLKLKRTQYYKDCIDYELIYRDSLILTARLLLNLIDNNNFDNLDNEVKQAIQDFINNTLALELSKNTNVTLYDLSNKTYDELLSNINSIDNNNLCFSENELLNNAKKLLK